MRSPKGAWSGITPKNSLFGWQLAIKKNVLLQS